MLKIIGVNVVSDMSLNLTFLSLPSVKLMCNAK